MSDQLPPNPPPFGDESMPPMPPEPSVPPVAPSSPWSGGDVPVAGPIPSSLWPGDDPSATGQIPMGDPGPPLAPAPAPVPDGAGGRSPTSLRTWLIAGVVAFLVGGLAVAVLSRSGSHSSTAAADSAASAGATSGAGSSNGAASGSSTANGGTGRPGFGRGTAGTIATIDGTSLTITGTDGTTTKVATDDSTVVTTSETLALGDIAVGDQVNVMGTTSGTDITAARIVDNGTDATNSFPGGAVGQPPSGSAPGGFDGQTPPTDQSGNQITPPSGAPDPSGATGQGGTGQTGRAGRGVRGQVTTVNGSTLTVTSQDGTVYTVTAPSTTTVTRTKVGALSDLAVGDQVSVIGQTGTDGTVTARRISEGTAFAGGFGQGGPGGQDPSSTTTTTN